MTKKTKKEKNKFIGYDFESYYDGISPEIKKMSLEELEEAIKKEEEKSRKFNGE